MFEHFNIFSLEVSFPPVSLVIFSVVFQHSNNISLELVLFIPIALSLLLLFSEFKHFKNMLLTLFSVIPIFCGLSPIIFEHFSNTSLLFFISFIEDDGLLTLSAIIGKLIKIKGKIDTFGIRVGYRIGSTKNKPKIKEVRTATYTYQDMHEKDRINITDNLIEESSKISTVRNNDLKDIKKVEDKITKENNDVISEKDAIDIIDNLTYNRL